MNRSNIQRETRGAQGRTSENAILPGTSVNKGKRIAEGNLNYRTARCSKRISWAPSPSTAWNASSGSFVFRDLHAIPVPPLPITPHTDPPPLQVLVGALRSGRRESLLRRHVPDDGHEVLMRPLDHLVDGGRLCLIMANSREQTVALFPLASPGGRFPTLGMSPSSETQC
jgi:hypothetical protein